MKNLKVGVSGVRGKYGDCLTQKVIASFLNAYVEFLGKKSKKGLVLGRDTRLSGPEIYNLIFQFLKKKKIKVIPVGILPTPTCQFAVKHFKTAGGIIITASHNPKEDNGLKFLNSSGIFLDKDNMQEVIDRFSSLRKKDYSPKLDLKSLNKKEKLIQIKNQRKMIQEHMC